MVHALRFETFVFGEFVDNLILYYVLEGSNQDKDKIFPQRNFHCPLHFPLEYKKHNKYVVTFYIEKV